MEFRFDLDVPLLGSECALERVRELPERTARPSDIPTKCKMPRRIGWIYLVFKFSDELSSVSEHEDFPLCFDPAG